MASQVVVPPPLMGTLLACLDTIAKTASRCTLLANPCNISGPPVCCTLSLAILSDPKFLLLEVHSRSVRTLATMLQKFADEFGKVMVFFVPGNHGRTTRKLQYKNLSYTNFDWLIGCMLEKFLMYDRRIQFYVTGQAQV
ncbi:MAG: hypothetical protein PF495_03915, partial [Spirochaetales bacterium]|nr:hypothetical protein [Spirochaetales bacterium]